MNDKAFATHLKKIVNKTKNYGEVDTDYFSWGRDSRHVVDNSEDILFNKANRNPILKKITNFLSFHLRKNKSSLSFLENKFKKFLPTYNLLSDDYSKNLYCEILISRYFGESKVELSSFTSDFINNYESASERLTTSTESLKVFKWILKKISPNETNFKIYTAPEILNMIESNRCYAYNNKGTSISVKSGDNVIDCGVGWGDTTMYLASLSSSKSGGKLFAFDILQDSFDALDQQMLINPEVKNIEKVHKAVTDQDDRFFYTTDPSPGAKIVDYETKFKVSSIKIDTFVEKKGISIIDFIKMDIEGAERDALKGAEKTIRKFKPKLAISIYHLKDDFIVIPELINRIRDDYKFYLDCTTGFGGETILYCD